MKANPYFRKTLKRLLVFSLMLWGSYAYAQMDSYNPQNKTDDPLRKPAIWKKLRTNPANLVVWEEYIGKTLNTMNPTEKEVLLAWKDALTLQVITDREAIITAHEKELESKKVSIEKSELTGLETILKEDRQEIIELRSNILENFVILEDIYNEIYKEFDVQYRYYSEVHPQDNFSKILWMEEQETKVKQLREQKVKQLREKYKIK